MNRMLKQVSLFAFVAMVGLTLINCGGTFNIAGDTGKPLVTWDDIQTMSHKERAGFAMDVWNGEWDDYMALYNAYKQVYPNTPDGVSTFPPEVKADLQKRKDWLIKTKPFIYQYKELVKQGGGETGGPLISEDIMRGVMAYLQVYISKYAAGSRAVTK